MIHNRLKFASQLMAPRGWIVRGFGLAFESTRVSIPATGSYCLATLMSSDRTKQICMWMTIEIYIFLFDFFNSFLFLYFYIFMIILLYNYVYYCYHHYWFFFFWIILFKECFSRISYVCVFPFAFYMKPSDEAISILWLI